MTCGLLIYPIFKEKIYESPNVSIMNIPKKQKVSETSLLNIQLSMNESVELSLPIDFKIADKEVKNGIPFTKLKTKKSKVEFYSISLEKDFLEKIKKVFLTNLPTSLIFYPALFFEPKIKDNILFYQSTKKKRLQELTRLLYSSMSLNLSTSSISEFLKLNGPFFFGPSKVKRMLQQKIITKPNGHLYRGVVSEYETVVLKNEKTLYFLQVSEEETLSIFHMKFETISDLDRVLETVFTEEDKEASLPGPSKAPNEDHSSSAIQRLLKNLPPSALKKIEELKNSLAL
jgi:hypothetical protein